jgi:hypothetical protein
MRVDNGSRALCPGTRTSPVSAHRVRGRLFCTPEGLPNLIRLFLGHTVQGAQAPDEVPTVNAYYLTVRKEAGGFVEKEMSQGVMPPWDECGP